MRIQVISLTLLFISCSHGENLMADQESNRLRGNPPEFGEQAMDTHGGGELEWRDLSSSTIKEASTVREGRSHVNEAEPGDDLGKREELLDSDGVTSDADKTPTTSKKATSTGTKKVVSASTKKAATSGTKKASTSAKKLSSTTAGGGTSQKTTAKKNSSAGIENKADSMEDNENVSAESSPEESTKKEPKVSSYSSGVYAPSICGKNRSEVESFCNSDLPICKFQTKQASGHEPFHITTDLRADQGPCIRRCDSKWGLSDKHCAQDEECHEGVVACTKCSLLNKRGCEAF